MDAIMWGVIIYIFSTTKEYQQFNPSFTKSKIKATLITILLLFLILTIPIHLQNIPTMVGFLAITCGILVVLASHDQGYVVPLIGEPLALWFGSRSFALYLCHMPIIYLTHEIWWRYTVMFWLGRPDASDTLKYFVTAIFLTYICAELNYRYVEGPMRRRGRAAASRILNTC